MYNNPQHRQLACRLAVVATIASVVAMPGAAFAHADHGAAGGFASGFTHPIGGLDHIVAMIAVGLWGAQLGKPAIWALPVAFPLMMAVGGFMGLVGVPIPGVEIGIALSAIVIGACVMFAAKPPLPVAVAIVAVFAIFHGHAHGTELPAGANGLLYSLGFVISTGLLHGVGIAIGEIKRVSKGPVALRTMGGLVTSAGVYFLVAVFL